MQNKETKIEPYASDDAPILGARKVWFLIDGEWKHCGWLMPQLPWPYQTGGIVNGYPR